MMIPIQYTALPREVDDDSKFKNTPLNQPQRIFSREVIIRLAIAVTAGFCGAIMYMATSLSYEPLGTMHAAFIVPLSHRIQIFRLDQNFVIPPAASGVHEPAWDRLLPNGLGYVRYPQSSQNMSVISVFHQLHCLYTLRRAYYAATNGSHELEDFDFGLDRDHHVAHCFDYLRQCLMCNADSTIEPTETSEYGFLGWGTERVCRDFDELKAWSTERRAFDGNGFLFSGHL